MRLLIKSFCRKGQYFDFYWEQTKSHFVARQITSSADFADLGVLGSFAETSEFAFFLSIDDDNLI